MNLTRPLLLVLAATAVASVAAQVFRPARDLRALALFLDSVPLIGTVVATAIVAVRLRGSRPPLIRLFPAVFSYFSGSVVAALGVAHLVAVVIVSIDRIRQGSVYTFHVYSVVLLGVLFVVTGVAAAIGGPRLARGEPAEWSRSVWVWTSILAINLPLVPLQRFAILFSALAVLNLMLIGGARHLEEKSTYSGNP